MEPEDLLPHDVEISRPIPFSITLVPALLIAQAKGRDVVEERIDPDVDDMFLVSRNRYSPGEVRSTDRHIIVSLPEPAQHLVPTSLRTNESRVVVEQLLDSVLEGTETEVVVLFRGSHEILSTDRRLEFKFACFRLRVILLLALVIPALEFAEICLLYTSDAADE